MIETRMNFGALADGAKFRTDDGTVYVKLLMTGIPVPKYRSSWGNARRDHAPVSIQLDVPVTHCYYTDEGLQDGEVMAIGELPANGVFRLKNGKLFMRRVDDGRGNAVPYDDTVYTFADDDRVWLIEEPDNPPEYWYFDEIR